MSQPTEKLAVVDPIWAAMRGEARLRPQPR